MALPARALPAPRIRNPRTARGATHRRIVAGRRSRYAGLRNVMLAIASVMTVLLLEVVLSAQITANAYAVDRAHAQRTELELQTARLDDEIAALSSDDRLAALAAKLGMIQPQRFLLVSLQAQAPARQPQPLAFLPQLK
jgi:cell division protein FtsL